MNEQLSACFIPFNGKNPYQPELVKNLQTHGVTVEKRMKLGGLFREALKGKRSPGIIHLHWLPHLREGRRGDLQILLFSLRLSLLKMLGKRVVWTVHNLYGHESRSKQREKRLVSVVLKKSSRVIVHARTSKELVAEEFGAEFAGKISVIPHGNYLESYENRTDRETARRKLEIDPGARVFLFFGYVRPYKGVDQLLNAFKNIKDANAILLIAGEPLNDALASEIREAVKDDSRVILNLESVPDGEAQDFFNAADVVVFPYQQVLTSGAVILAMSFGKACIAPRLGSIPETVEEGEGGFLYDSASPEGLTSSLQKALEAGDALTRMGEVNHERARTWDWSSIAGRTAEVYREALTGN